ncbi:MAG: hypothetical protein J6Q38_04975 [Clostridia bacterium]|nr:hypothetical protein [Clostridia bacterium]
MAKKNGIFTRLIEGPERSEDYARSTMPTNRWGLGWDLFKMNMGKLIKINLLILLFIFPIFLLLYLRDFLISVEAGVTPFSQNLGIGYPIYPFIEGFAESIVIKVDIIIFAILYILTFYVSVGIAGGFYVMRNLVWTEGVFVASDFWAGVKKNYKNTMLLSLIFTLFLTMSLSSINTCDYQMAINPESFVLFTIFKVISYVFISFFTCIYLYSLSIGVTYDLKLFKIIKNAFIYTVGIIPFNIFFMAFSLIAFIPLLFNPTSFLFSLGIMLCLFLSFSVFLLIWVNYTQWVFDETINSKIAGAKKYRGIYKKNVAESTEEFDYEKSKFQGRRIKPITDYDVEIVELPTSFTREDLIRLEESKKRMREDSDNYVKEHLSNESLNTDIDEFMKDEEGSNE